MMTNKNAFPRRVIAVILSGILIALCFSGCAGNTAEPTTQAPTAPEQTGESVAGEQTSLETEDTVFSGRDDIAYVLIYNPEIYYEETDDNRTVNTGNFDKWIDAGAFRAEPPSEELPFRFTSQGDLKKEADGMDVDLTGSRASVPQPEFRVGDTAKYYYDDDTSKKQDTFRCVFSGSHCCFWTLQDAEIADEAMLERIANEFDTKIYPADVEAFGSPRYADVNGKIHVLFHPMDGYTLGYFWQGDLYTHEELSDAEAERYGANRDLAMIHLNAGMLRYPDLEEIICSTLAHELQHLINFTDGIEYNGYSYASTWINESMSGYIEEKLYPGVKDAEGHYESFVSSDLIRHGQSMYHFGTEDRDIGVYGSVFLYSQYLEGIAGETVFRDFHNYWRTTFDPNRLFDENALYAVVPETVRQEIDGRYEFPSKLQFEDQYTEFMSKLTLDFYISLLKYDSSDPDAYQKVEAQALLYDEINPADIEGGGRVIAATKDGHFEIPDDAGIPLVFIGFDKDMNQITGVVVS